jgi:hypothetical protein
MYAIIVILNVIIYLQPLGPGWIIELGSWIT